MNDVQMNEGDRSIYRGSTEPAVNSTDQDIPAYDPPTQTPMHAGLDSKLASQLDKTPSLM